MLEDESYKGVDDMAREQWWGEWSWVNGIGKEDTANLCAAILNMCLFKVINYSLKD